MLMKTCIHEPQPQFLIASYGGGGGGAGGGCCCTNEYEFSFFFCKEIHTHTVRNFSNIRTFIHLSR